jgi:hypothetical protein
MSPSVTRAGDLLLMRLMMEARRTFVRLVVGATLQSKLLSRMEWVSAAAAVGVGVGCGQMGV